MQKTLTKNGFVQRWFQKQLQIIHSNTMAADANLIASRVDSFYFQKGLNIKVFFASNGGKVIKISKFDEIKGPDYINQEKLYIIKEDEDFGQAINNIVTMEALR